MHAEEREGSAEVILFINRFASACLGASSVRLRGCFLSDESVGAGRYEHSLCQSRTDLLRRLSDGDREWAVERGAVGQHHFHSGPQA